MPDTTLDAMPDLAGGSSTPVYQVDAKGALITTQSVVTRVDNEFTRRQKERRAFELQWRINIAFIEGQQYLEMNTATMALDEIPKIYEWQEREVFNHIGPIAETRISKLSRVRPVLTTRPGTNSQEDIRSAKVGTMVLKNVYYDEDVTDKMAELIGWLEGCGTAFLKNVWDPNKGRAVAMMQNGDEQSETLREGDIDVVVVPAQEIFPDSSYHQNIAQCKSIIHAKAYHVDDIEEIWGKRIQPESTTVMQMQKSLNGIGGLGYGIGGFNYVSTSLTSHALVKEYSERPTKRFPKGRLIIVAGGQLLSYVEELPFLVGKDAGPSFNFTKIDCIKRQGCFWGRSIIERLIPIQRRYNALRNRKAEALNRIAIGQWIVENDSLVAGIEAFETQAGAPGAIHEIRRNTTHEPKMVQTPPLQGDFQIEERSLLQEFSMMSGVSELSRQSAAPPGVKSGVALSIALEQDDTRLSSTAGNIESGMIDSGKQWLRLYKQFAKGPRTMRDIGKDNIVNILDWTGADIRSDDVVIEGTSAIVESPAQKRQMTFDLLQAGLFNDPETGRISKEGQAKIFEMLEMGNWDAGDDETQLHLQKAERENRTMAEGGQAMIVPYDDDLLHIARHNRYRLTTDYEELLAANPLLDMLFSQHVQMHMENVQNKAMQQLQEQMAMQALTQPQPQPAETNASPIAYR